MSLLRVILFLTLLLATSGCDGGSSSFDNGLVIEGTLIQGGVEGHARFSPKHSAGEPISEVEICMLGSCSITDDLGQWGFAAADDSPENPVTFTIHGHGIDGTTEVEIPPGARDVTIDFVNIAGQVSAEHVTADGIHQGHEHGE